MTQVCPFNKCCPLVCIRLCIISVCCLCIQCSIVCTQYICTCFCICNRVFCGVIGSIGNLICCVTYSNILCCIQQELHISLCCSQQICFCCFQCCRACRICLCIPDCTVAACHCFLNFGYFAVFQIRAGYCGMPQVCFLNKCCPLVCQRLCIIAFLCAQCSIVCAQYICTCFCICNRVFCCIVIFFGNGIYNIIYCNVFCSIQKKLHIIFCCSQQVCFRSCQSLCSCLVCF